MDLRTLIQNEVANCQKLKQSPYPAISGYLMGYLRMSGRPEDKAFLAIIDEALKVHDAALKADCKALFAEMGA